MTHFSASRQFLVDLTDSRLDRFETYHEKYTIAVHMEKLLTLDPDNKAPHSVPADLASQMDR